MPFITVNYVNPESMGFILFKTPRLKKVNCKQNNSCHIGNTVFNDKLTKISAIVQTPVINNDLWTSLTVA
jgi:hypothetical protein